MLVLRKFRIRTKWMIDHSLPSNYNSLFFSHPSGKVHSGKYLSCCCMKIEAYMVIFLILDTLEMSCWWSIKIFLYYQRFCWLLKFAMVPQFLENILFVNFRTIIFLLQGVIRCIKVERWFWHWRKRPVISKFVCHFTYISDKESLEGQLFERRSITMF